MLSLILYFVITMSGGLMFINTRTGDTATLQDIVKDAENYNVVIFGEKHDSKDCHNAEEELLIALSKNYPLIFSMEMFERDVQEYMDSYLKGRVTEEEFLKNSRPWSNYKDDYRPLVEYCKKQGIYVLASNVPRYIASRVAKSGPSVLDSLTGNEKAYVAGKVYYDNPEYRERFYETMEKIHMPGFSQQMKENYYRAQCLKDATMAESILNVLRSHKGYKVFHINGSFHSDYRLGVVFQLAKLDSSIKVLVISPLEKGESLRGKEKIGDYVFFYEK